MEWMVELNGGTPFIEERKKGTRTRHLRADRSGVAGAIRPFHFHSMPVGPDSFKV
jgi:hypothetical protein